MRAAAAALATISAVPFSALPFVHLALFLLHAGPQDEVVDSGRSSVLARDDACTGAACAFSTLQQRARGTRASGAASRGGAAGRSASGHQRSAVDFSLEELDALAREGERANYSLEELSEQPCEDMFDFCEPLAEKWWNCMSLDTSQVPRPPMQSLRPVEFLQRYCRKTCAWCGNEQYIQKPELRMFRSDEVEKELSYAKAGDMVPEVLHGIFWMDQRGFHKEGWKCDPDFHYNFEDAACGEILLTTGDGAEWHPKRKCLRGTAFTGRQGHWTYMNEGSPKGNRLFATNNAPARMGGEFCQMDDEGNYWDIPVKVLPQSLWEIMMWKTITAPDSEGFFKTPSWLSSFTMKKTCFGFARRTTQGAEWMMPKGALYYPIFQIVDGYGRKTEHWDAYIAYTNTVGKNCHGRMFGGEPCNVGDGMQFTPVMTKKKIKKGDVAYPEVEYLKLFDTGRLADA